MELKRCHNPAGILPVSGFSSRVQAKRYQIYRDCSGWVMAGVCCLCCMLFGVVCCGISLAQNTSEKTIRGAIFTEGGSPLVGARVGCLISQSQLELAKTWYGEKRFVLSLRQLDLIAIA